MNSNIKKMHQNELRKIDTEFCLKDYLQSVPLKKKMVEKMKHMKVSNWKNDNKKYTFYI